jgi:hypothetical protein
LGALGDGERVDVISHLAFEVDGGVVVKVSDGLLQFGQLPAQRAYGLLGLLDLCLQLHLLCREMPAWRVGRG